MLTSIKTKEDKISTPEDIEKLREYPRKYCNITTGPFITGEELCSTAAPAEDTLLRVVSSLGDLRNVRSPGKGTVKWTEDITERVDISTFVEEYLKGNVNPSEEARQRLKKLFSKLQENPPFSSAEETMKWLRGR